MKKDLTTLFTGRHCTFLKEVDSTNTFLSSKLRQEVLPEGAVVRAFAQNAGRGQAGTIWESASGKNLLLSYLFYPRFITPKHVFDLNKAFALGVYDFISASLISDVAIKWPNDIYWKKKKVAGMLVENSMNNSVLNYSILGIGININQEIFSDKLPNPVSFRQVTGKEYDLDEIFYSLSSFIESRYLQLKSNDLKKIEEDYHSALFLSGQWAEYEAENQKFMGMIRRVDDNGKIVLELKDGQVREFELKEIRFVL